MTNRRLRMWSLALPLVGATYLGLLAACGDDDSGTGTVNLLDGSPDQTSPQNEAGADAKADVITPIDAGPDVQLPPLCLTYGDALVDAGEGLDQQKRYYQIAYNAIGDSYENLCELSAALDPGENGDFFAPPDPIGCLGIQLAALAGCQGGAGAVQYTSTTNDPLEPAALCAPDSGTDPFVWLGFKLDPNNPQPPLVKVDVDLMIAQIRKAALGLGYSAQDADRLIALLHAQKARIATVDAGADGGHSYSACP